MKTTLSHLVLLLLGLLTTSATVLADGHRGTDHPARRELKAYVEQNVLPVVRQQRQKLEAQLAGADKAQLGTYRAQLKELRQRGQALRQSFRANQATAPKTTEPATPHASLTDEQRQQLRQLHTESRAIMQNVAQLAQKYESNIAQLTQAVQPQQEKWTSEMQAIITRNAPPAQPVQPARQPRLQGRMPHHAGAGRLLQPTAFLLLDPAAPAPAERAVSGATLSPNPVAATSHLEYGVTKAGPVTVELLDGRGNILRILAQEARQEKGTHTLPVSLGDLSAGTYYYKITTRAGSETKRFVKE